MEGSAVAQARAALRADWPVSVPFEIGELVIRRARLVPGCPDDLPTSAEGLFFVLGMLSMHVEMEFGG